MSTVDERRFLRMMLKVIQQVRKEIDPEMPIQTLQTFVHIALEDDMPQRTVENLLNMSRAGASRNVLNLTDLTAQKNPGPSLIRQTASPADRRSTLLSLTPKGHKFVKDLTAAANTILDKEGVNDVYHATG